MTTGKIDFFGIGKVKDMKRPKASKGIKANVSFLGKPKPLMTSKKYSPSQPSSFSWGLPLYRKERTTDKKLSKWGDADLDGTPNYFDCDARNWMKDAKVETGAWNEKESRGRKVKKITPEQIASATQEAEGMKKKLKKEYLKSGKAAIRRAEYQEDISQIIKKTGKAPRASKIRRLAELEAGPERSKELYERKRKAMEEKPWYKIQRVSTKEKVLLERIKKDREEGKETSEKDIKEQLKLEKQRKISQKAITAAKSLKKLTVGEITTKSGEYTAEAKARSRRVKRLVTRGISSLFGANVLGAGERGGRPKGPTGKYMIEGKPVYEAEFQEYQSKQRALNRILPSEVQQAPMSQERMNRLQAPQEQPPAEEMSYEQSAQPVEAGDEQMPVEQPVPQTSRYGEFEEAQQLAQQTDNVLNAPVILKGELKATGGSLLTPTGPQILAAPQFMKGHMRTMQTGEVPAVRLGERPQTNPTGDTYLDIELGSGKPMVKRRITEKWMSGEAL